MFHLKQSVVFILALASLAAAVASPFRTPGSSDVLLDFPLSSGRKDADTSESTFGKRATQDGTVQRESDQSGVPSFFTANFVIEASTYTYTGDFGRAIFPIDGTAATLTYSNVTELQGSISFSGTEGTDVAEILLDNGPAIDWGLSPLIGDTLLIQGTGAWTVTTNSA